MSHTNHHPIERIYPDDKRVKPETIQHHMKRYRFVADSITRRSDILDLACGTGYGADMLRKARIGNTATGVDISSEAIDYAQAHYPTIPFVKANLSTFKINMDYDIITFFEAIEHLTMDEGVKVLKKAYKALKPGGMLFLSTPVDINHDHNGWHKSQWEYNTLLSTVDSIFDEVDMMAQTWETGEIEWWEYSNKRDFYFVVARKL